MTLMLDNQERRHVHSIVNCSSRSTYSSVCVCVLILSVLGQSTEKQTNLCNKYETLQEITANARENQRYMYLYIYA
jgi:hypothetical protein